MLTDEKIDRSSDVDSIRDFLVNRQDLSIEAIFNTLPAAIYIIEAETFKFVHYNQLARLYFSHADRNAVGLTLDELLSSEQDALHVKQIIDEILASLTPVDYPEYVSRGADGKTRIIHVRLTPILNEAKRATHLLGIAWDVTSRVETEKKLEHQLSLQDAVQEAIGKLGEGMVLCDIEKPELLFFNKAAEELTGYRREKLPVGYSLLDFFAPEEREKVKQRIEQRLQGQDDLDNFQTILKRYDGSLLPVEMNAKKLASETGQQVLVLFRDNSERLRHQEMLQNYNTELEAQVVKRTAEVVQLQIERIKTEKLAAAGKLAAAVAHEINNPLAGIKNCFALLKKAIPADFEHADYVPLVDEEIDRIACILRKMFELYHPEPEKAAAFSLQKMLGYLQILHQPIAAKKNVRLILEKHNLSEANILPRQSLNLILTNLVTNAIDAAPPDSEIKIIARSNEQTITFCVRDQGAGIDAAIAEKIFEPFFTTKKKKCSDGGGMGMGLAISRALAESMGGQLKYERTENGETEFSFTLTQKFNR